jgi:hypothetical protein
MRRAVAQRTTCQGRPIALVCHGRSSWPQGVYKSRTRVTSRRCEASLDVRQCRVSVGLAKNASAMALAVARLGAGAIYFEIPASFTLKLEVKAGASISVAYETGLRF